MFLLIIYLLFLVLQIVLLVKAIKRKAKKQWLILFALEVVPMFIALWLWRYYENLPGYGFMPGLSYLGEVLFSFFAGVLYGVNFLISACICLVQKKKQNRIFSEKHNDEIRIDY